MKSIALLAFAIGTLMLIFVTGCSSPTPPPATAVPAATALPATSIPPTQPPPPTQAPAPTDTAAPPTSAPTQAPQPTAVPTQAPPTTAPTQAAPPTTQPTQAPPTPAPTAVPPTPAPTSVPPTQAVPTGPVTITASCTNGCAFTPKEVHIKKGTKVIWQSANERHEIVTDDWDSPNPGPNTIKGGPDYQFSPGETVEFVFQTPGRVPYFCGFHGKAMSAVIVVEE